MAKAPKSKAAPQPIDERPWPATQSRNRLVADLVPYARNARTHSPEQIEQVAKSIRRFGWTMPVLVRLEDDGIIAGHGRILAAEYLGIEEVPTVEAIGWTDEEVRAYILADNKLSLNAGWDETILAAELKDLAELGFDMDLIGFSDEELAALNPEASPYNREPDEVPEVGPKPVSVSGDVWILGPHRVTCGDATTLAPVERVLDGAMADALWTDPPYNVNYEGAAGKIENDHMEGDDFAAFLLDAFVCAFAMLKPGSPAYVAHADLEGVAFRASFVSAGFKLSTCLIWRKNALVLGRADYQWQHEPILYGWKPGAAHRWFGGRKATSVADLSDGTVFGKNSDGSYTVRVGQQSLIIRGSDLEVEAIEPTVIEADKPSASSDHPTMKPVALIERMLKNSTRTGDIVLDLFGGSGSTLIACEMLGRHARLVELDPRFVDVIVRRWEEFTGKVATLAGTDASFSEIASQRVGGGGPQ